MNYIKYLSALILCSASLRAFAQNDSGTLNLSVEKQNVLKSGIYIVVSDLSLDMNSYGVNINGPAIKIAEKSTVTIIIPAGKILSLVGRNARQGDYNQTNAYPAIELPSSSTLILKGSGTLNAIGGNGDSGNSYGRTGGNGDYSCHDWAAGGPGGEGGEGGYGSAPGIGTPAGKGGKGGKCEGKALCPQKLEYNRMSDKKSGNGKDGGSTSTMGQLIILGNLTVKSIPGSVPRFVQTNADHGVSTFDEHNRSCRDYFSCGSGGGGGQGGAAVRARYGIGAGAPGAGGGGAGGSGGVDDQYWRRNLDWFNGRGGEGGKSTAGNGGNGKREDGFDDGGAYGGDGGKCGKAGNNGKVYYSITSTFNGGDAECFSMDYATSLNELSKEEILKILPVSDIHQIRGAVWGSTNSIDFYSGMSLSAAAPKVVLPTAHSDTHKFAGYADQYGNQVYNEKGELDIVKNADFFPYVATNDKKWFINSDVDITLNEIRQNTVRLFVSHYIEDPNFSAGDNYNRYSSHAPVFSEDTVLNVQSGTSVTFTVKAFHDIHGNLLDFSGEGRDSLYYSGIRDELVYLDGTQPIVKASLIYDRKSYPLEWDYSSMLTDEEFDALLENEDTYTRSGMVKYGQEIIPPRLKRYKNIEFVYWQNELDNFSRLQGTMPANGVKAVLKDGINKASYLITQNVDQTDTECDITCSKLTDIAYQEPVDILAHFVGDTRISNISVVNNLTGDALALTQKNDSVFSFLMPGSDVTVNARFVKAHYKLMSSISNKYATKVAIKDPKGIYYTDDNDYFHFADSLLGGGLDDLAVYQGERITVIPEIDQSMIETDEQEYEFRPMVQVHKGNDKYDDHTWDKNEIYGGRVYRSYVYDIVEAKETHVKVVWTKRVNKKIVINHHNDMGYHANISEIFTDASPDVYSELSMEGQKNLFSTDTLVACYNDVVCFAVESDCPDFDESNITVTYFDVLLNRDIQVPVRTAGSVDGSGKMYYQFVMPGRNTEINLYTGRKVVLGSNLPSSSNYMAGDEFVSASSENARDYRVIMPEYGVVGSEVPFFIVRTTSPNDIKNPVAVYEGNRGIAPTSFDYYNNENISEETDYGQGAFIVPDTEDDVELRNGYLTKIDPAYFWFSIRSGEALILPSGLKAYTVTVNPDRTFDMSEIYGGFVPKGCAVIISIDPEWFEDFMDSDDDIFFLDTDPNKEGSLVGENDLRGVIRQWTCGELSDSLRAETGFDYDIYIMRYDPALSTIVFEIAPYDKILYEGDAYLPVLHDGSDQTIFPTGIDAPEIFNHQPSTDNHQPSFTITGSQVNGAYRGIIIRHGKKILQLNLHK